MKVKDLKTFMEMVPDTAEVLFSKGTITFAYADNIYAVNKDGGQWHNGIGYAPGATSCSAHSCGECSYFDCSKCLERRLHDVSNR